MPSQMRITNRGETFVILLDDEDLWKVQDFGWTNGAWFVATHGYVLSSRTYLHRFLMGCSPGDGLVVDHVNHDKLDNRKVNLRIGSQADNMQNVAAHTDARSSHRGVSWSNSNRGWIAQAMRNGVRKHLGTFATEELASSAVEEFWRG